MSLPRVEHDTVTPTILRPAQFPVLEATEHTGRQNFDLVLDLDLSLTVELGRASLPVREVVALEVGSIIELDNQPGDPVEIVVNERIIARGEVVVVDDRFGVRITEILKVSQPVR